MWLKVDYKPSIDVIDLADSSLIQLCHVTKLNEGRIGLVYKQTTKSSHSDRCKILSDGIPISHGTLYGDLGGITIFRPPGQMVIDAI